MTELGQLTKPTGKSYLEGIYKRHSFDERAEYVSLYNNDPTINPPVPVELITIQSLAEQAAEVKQRFDVFTGIGTGFPSLDMLTLGFAPGEYIVLGAGTNVGKTQLACYIATHAAAEGIPTLYISREQSNIDIHTRMAHITNNSILPAHLQIPATHRLKPEAIAPLVEKFQAQYAGKHVLIIVDHLHAFIRGERLTEGLGKLSEFFRDLAQDTGATVVALSQLNRKEYKPETGPDTYHLKESSYIEEDASAILLAWRVGQELRIRLAKSRARDIHEAECQIITLQSAKGHLTDLNGATKKPTLQESVI